MTWFYFVDGLIALLAGSSLGSMHTKISTILTIVTIQYSNSPFPDCTVMMSCEQKNQHNKFIVQITKMMKILDCIHIVKNVDVDEVKQLQVFPT